MRMLSNEEECLVTEAKANKLDLQDIPTELSDLNPMEECLISLRIPFMKMVALPCGKLCAIHGPAVYVPTDLKSIVVQKHMMFSWMFNKQFNNIQF